MAEHVHMTEDNISVEVLEEPVDIAEMLSRARQSYRILVKSEDDFSRLQTAIDERLDSIDHSQVVPLDR